MEVHDSRFDVELAGDIEADVGKLGGLQIVRARQCRRTTPWAGSDVDPGAVYA